MKNYYLQNLMGEHEKVLLATRQHFFVLFSSIFLELILLAIITAVVVVLATTQTNPLFWGGMVLIIIPLVGLVRDYLVWNNREYIVTNRRVIQIDGIIKKTVTDSSLEKVNDVKMIQSFWGRLFHFGDVEILTASELGVNRFKRIGNPVRFKIAMLNAKEALGSDENGFMTDERRSPTTVNDIPRLIADLDDLRQKGTITTEEFETKKKDLLDKI